MFFGKVDNMDKTITIGIATIIVLLILGAGACAVTREFSSGGTASPDPAATVTPEPLLGYTPRPTGNPLMMVSSEGYYNPDEFETVHHIVLTVRLKPDFEPINTSYIQVKVCYTNITVTDGGISKNVCMMDRLLSNYTDQTMITDSDNITLSIPSSDFDRPVWHELVQWTSISYFVDNIGLADSKVTTWRPVIL
jgi:hypothetical protein